MSPKPFSTRVNRDARTIMEEIVSQLEQVDGAEVELTFEVRARSGAGIPVPTQRAVSESCNTLHIGDYRFDGWVWGSRLVAAPAGPFPCNSLRT